MDLNDKKYSELQSIAKEIGLRANLKSDKLKKAIQEYYSTHKNQRSLLGDKKVTDGTVVPKKRKRRNTYEVEDCDSDFNQDINDEGGRDDNRRSSIQELVDAMDVNTSRDTMKRCLTEALDKKVSRKMKEEAATRSKIPRYKMTERTTPSSKDWSKIHQRHFDKMDSIDVYLAKKRQRTAALYGKSDDVTDTLDKARAALERHRNYKTPEAVRKNTKKAPPQAKLFPTPPAEEKVFKPSVLSTRNINLNFNENTTQPHVSAGLKFNLKNSNKNNDVLHFTAGLKSGPKIVKPVIARRKSPRIATTPRKLDAVTVKSSSKRGGGNLHAKETSFSSKFASSKKQSSFNLQESLSRPLSWIPYTGKLKPVASGKFGKVCDHSQSSRIPLPSDAVQGPIQAKRQQLMKIQQLRDKKAVKTPPLKSSQTRRVQAAKDRADRQFDEIMKRRGLAK